MDKEYEIIGEFYTNGKHMVVVMIGGNAHAIDGSELRWIFGCWHPERWKNKWKKGA